MSGKNVITGTNTSFIRGERIRRKIGRFLVALVGTLAVLVAAVAVAAECPSELARSADNSVESVSDWASLYKAYMKFRACDDGSIAEGFSDRVATLLASKWATLPQLNDLITKDKTFKAFVLRHIDETADSTALRSIVAYIDGSGCPGVPKPVCMKIRARTEESLANLPSGR